MLLHCVNLREDKGIFTNFFILYQRLPTKSGVFEILYNASVSWWPRCVFPLLSEFSRNIQVEASHCTAPVLSSWERQIDFVRARFMKLMSRVRQHYEQMEVAFNEKQTVIPFGTPIFCRTTPQKGYFVWALAGYLVSRPRPPSLYRVHIPSKYCEGIKLTIASQHLARKFTRSITIKRRLLNARIIQVFQYQTTENQSSTNEMTFTEL